MLQQRLSSMALLATFITVITLAMVSMAQPAQRIIIGFETALTESSTIEMEARIGEILEQPVKRIVPSNETRWVLELTPPLTPSELEKLIAKLQLLDNVRYVEPDQLLQIQPINTNNNSLQ